jgi:hypothetical protein
MFCWLSATSYRIPITWNAAYVAHNLQNILPKCNTAVEKLFIVNDHVQTIDMELPRLRALRCEVAMSFEWVAKLTTIRELFFDFYQLDDDNVTNFLSDKPIFPHLESVTFSHLSLKTKMVPFLIAMFSPTLKSVTFSQCTFADTVWDELAAHVDQRFKSVRNHFAPLIPLGKIRFKSLSIQE